MVAVWARGGGSSWDTASRHQGLEVGRERDVDSEHKQTTLKAFRTQTGKWWYHCQRWELGGETNLCGK